MPLPVKTVRNVNTNGFVAVNNAVVQLMLDGAAAANTIAVAANTEVIITDVVASSSAATNFSVQQSNDGVAFFDILSIRIAADGTVGITELRTPLRIVGGAAVVFRAFSTGNSNVSASIRSYLEQNV